MNILITGITGFSGSHLAEHLLNKGNTIYGLSRGRYQQYNNISDIKDKITLIEGDLSDIHSLKYCLEDCQPDIIYNLGAMTSVPLSWRSPKVTIDTNTLGTLNILESVRTSNINPTVVIVGTSEEYGKVYPDEVPIKETNQLRPLSPYGVSKVASDLLGYQYNKSYGIRTIRIRPFNIIGVRGGEEIVTANFAIQLKRIKDKKQKYLKIGNLESIRDFLDTKDLCRAYEICIDNCKYGDVYNVCTGVGYKIRELAQKMIDISGLDVDLKQEDNRIRPSDVDNLIGDCNKFKNKTGWKPEITLDESLEKVIKYWGNVI